MFGLTRDFVQHNGTFMMLERPSGISYQEINRVQMGMILSTTIPHFLPLRLKELDNNVTLQYEITGKKMLSHLVRSEKISMAEYYALLLQVITTLDESKNYMLQPDKYIVHEDYIFVEGPIQTGKLYLAYVPMPLDTQQSTTPLQDALDHLVTRLMTTVTELKGGGVQALMQLIRSDRYSLQGLRGLLHELMAADDGNAAYPNQSYAEMNDRQHAQPYRISYAAPVAGYDQTAPRAGKGMDLVQPPHAVNVPARTGKTPRTSEPARMSEPAKMKENPAKIKERQRDDKKSGDFFSDSGFGAIDKEVDEEETASPIRTYIALGCLLTCAILWKLLYFDNESTLMLIACVVTSVLLAIVAWLGWIGKLPIWKSGGENVSEELSSFDSGELAFDAAVPKRGAHFQVEMLTGFIKGNKKAASQEEPSDQAPSWMRPLNIQASPFQESNDVSYAAISRSSSGANYAGQAQYAVMDNSVQSSTEHGDYYSTLGQNTQVLNASQTQATVMLSSELSAPVRSSESPVSVVRYLLERYAGDSSQAQIIDLTTPHFTIGRSAQVAQFVEDAPGTSRAHVELTRTEEGYVLKDLGSMNGTILNNEPMAPYKDYPLLDGSSFLIAKNRYTFRKQ